MEPVATTTALIIGEVAKVLLRAWVSYMKQAGMQEEEIHKAYRTVMDEVRLLNPDDLPN